MVSAIMPNALSNGLRQEFGYLLDTCRRYDITSKNRIAAFLANVAKESGELAYVEEIADGRDYEGRSDLGNIHAGDGERYKGRGYIQITGRNNYRQVGQALGIDAEGDPEILPRMPYAWLSAGWYWRYGSSWGDLNDYADSGDFGSTVLGVRGGPDPDRWRYWYAALEALPDDLDLTKRSEKKMVKASEIVAAAREILGASYVWWKDGDPIPKWSYDYPNSSPGASWIFANGTMCSDTINFARQECGLEPIGGTPAYYDWLQASGGVTFDPATPGVAGALCVNPGVWRGGIGQGHIALYTDEHTLLQADSSRGVNEGEPDYVSHGWVEGGFWLYGLMPDVDYGDDAEALPASPALPDWFGVGADSQLRMGGDWSKGWIDIGENGWLRYIPEYQGASSSS